MSKKLWYALSAILVASMLVLAGCGGDGSSSNGLVTDPNFTNLSSGIAVDPYIVGAVFQEISADGEVIQESAPSNEKGVFVFPNALRKGSTITIKVTEKGVHNGAPFQGILKRKVDAAGGELVASPITTLLAEGKTASEIIGLLKSVGADLTESDLTANPMARMEKAQVTEEDRAVMAATIALNSALVLNDGDTDLEALRAPMIAVSTKLKEVLAQDGVSVEATLRAAVSISDLIVKTTQKMGDSSDVATVTNEITTSIIEKTIADSKNEPVILEKSEDGTFTSTTPTVRGFLNKGFAALKDMDATGSNRSLVNAVDYFKLASNAINSDTSASGADQDTARFFGGLAQVAALSNPFSDGTANGLNNLGDILDAFGPEGRSAGEITLETCVDAVDADGNIITNPYDGTAYQVCDIKLPEGAPTTGDLQKFLYGKLTTELKDAIAQLEQVTDGFQNTEWIDSADGTRTEFDYSDALFFKGLAQSMLAQVFIQQAYDVNVDLYEEQVASESGNETTQSFLAANPNLGRLLDKGKLAEAKTFIAGSIDDLIAAINAIKTEEDNAVADQQDDFLSLYTESCTWDDETMTESCVESSEDIEKNLTDLALAKEALAGQITVGDNGTPDNASDDRVVDFTKVFSGIDIRSKVPSFIGDAPGLFPDANFDDLLVQGFDMNRDWDGDGSPDELMGYTQFSEEMMKPFPFHGYFSLIEQDSYSNDNWFDISLKADGTFNRIEWGYDANTQTWTQIPVASGSWSISNGSLVLNGDDINSPYFQKLHLTLSQGDGNSYYFWADGTAAADDAQSPQWNFYLYDDYLN